MTIKSNYLNQYKNIFGKLFKTNVFASVKLTIFLMSTLTGIILIGAWCPQKSQVGMEKVTEQFGEQNALFLDKLGITDIFHSNFFLTVIALLTINMIACSMQRVFPKYKLYKKPLLFFNAKQISKMPYVEMGEFSGITPVQAIDRLKIYLEKKFYKVNVNGQQLNAQGGKISKFAASVTHVGLLSLLFGVTITSWTGFSGIEPVGIGQDLDFSGSEHANYWFGHLPNFKVRLNSTSKESYASGQVKQWYSNLSVIDNTGKVVQNQTISVNEPLSYHGVDVYQSNWGLNSAQISFNGNKRKLMLRPMGAIWAAFLPIEADTILIMSFKNEKEPLKLFAKREEWSAPKLITQIPLHGSVNLGSVKVTYDKINPVSGLQYKSDPGLPIVYFAFGFIILGVMMATLPYSELYVCIDNSEDENKKIIIGGICPKAPSQFKNLLNLLLNSLPESSKIGQNNKSTQSNLASSLISQ